VDLRRKRQKFFDRSPDVVTHPAGTLWEAAVALDYDAKMLDASGDAVGATHVRRVASSIRKVAEGQSWAAAFEWDLPRKPLG
jgi:hypothetical protein